MVDIIAQCDLIMTAVVDNEWAQWDSDFDDRAIATSHPFKSYKAKPWVEYEPTLLYDSTRLDYRRYIDRHRTVVEASSSQCD